MTPTGRSLAERIVELVPEIKELKFGCRIKDRQYGFGYVTREPNQDDLYAVYFPDYAGGVNTFFSTRKDAEPNREAILGRPITLADVLRAIEKIEKQQYIAVTPYGVFLGCKNLNIGRWENVCSSQEAWNLSTDLDGQNPETKQFLEKILLKP